MKENKVSVLRRFGTGSGKVALLLFCAMIGPLVGAPAGAVTAVNILPVGEKGGVVAGPYKSDFLTLSSLDIGDLTGQVWHNAISGIYTYEYALKPGTSRITEFNTGFAVSGFNGIAGYSWANAQVAGAPSADGSGAFLVTLDPDGTLDWNVPFDVRAAGFWTTNLAEITFFFQSTHEPDSTKGGFNIFAAGKVAGADNFKPSAVPEPSSFLLLASGLIGLVGAGWKRWK